MLREDDEQTHAALARLDPAASMVRVAHVGVAGVVGALEAGRVAARGDHLALTDDDAVPDPDWLARIAEHFDRDPGLGAVGGRDRLAGNSDPPVRSEAVGGISWYGRRVGEHHRGSGPPRRVDVLKGVNVAFRRDALDPVGFDRRLRGSGAQRHWELAVCLAVGRAGWGVLYDPAIEVGHDEGSRFGDNQRGFGDLAELRAAAHNDAYATVRWLPPHRKPPAFLYGLLVGSREAPGLATALERALRTGQWRTMLHRLRAATRGRIDALGTYADVLRDRS